MLGELRTVGLIEAARRLGVHPFELVRLAVVADSVPGRFHFDDDLLDTLRQAGGLQAWWEDRALPQGGSDAERVARGVLQLLFEHGAVSPKSTRMDNLWRGLSVPHQVIAQGVVSALVEAEMLTSEPTPAGVQVGVASSHAKTLRKAAEGGALPAQVQAGFPTE